MLSILPESNASYNIASCPILFAIRTHTITQSGYDDVHARYLVQTTQLGTHTVCTSFKMGPSDVGSAVLLTVGGRNVVDPIGGGGRSTTNCGAAHTRAPYSRTPQTRPTMSIAQHRITIVDRRWTHRKQDLVWRLKAVGIYRHVVQWLANIVASRSRWCARERV